MDLSLTALEATTFHVKGLKKDESEGTFTKPPVWTVDNSSIVKITPATDGLSCSIEAAQPFQPGTAVVTVTDTDDSNVPPITVNVTIVGDPITHLRVDIDPPSVKTPI